VTAGAKTYRIMLLPGDGVGPEVTTAACRVLDEVAVRFGFTIAYETGLLGGCAIDEVGSPMEDGLVERCLADDAVLLGAVGGPAWETTDPDKPRPEQGLLGIRSGLGLYANLRPVKALTPLAHNSTLKPEVIADVDLVIVRELTGGAYFGKRERTADTAYDTISYHRDEIERVVDLACRLALDRRGEVTSVDKANVLESSRLWREVAEQVGSRYDKLLMRHLYADNVAMQIVRAPRQFDVLVTENLFGDILSDEAAMLTGSIGMLPSASVGGKVSLYEPIHGSAPDIQGQGLANPCGTILAVAMMLELSLDRPAAARAVEDAVVSALDAGARTRDIAAEGEAWCTTSEMTDRIIAELLSAAG
jgi:3-isopropylmalate dehydrogenase